MVSILLFGKQIHTPEKADVLLVLGAKAYRDGSYNPCLLSRIDHAVTLYTDQLATKILFSVGTDVEDNVNEAETMKSIAQNLGVPAHNILFETEASSTFENLVNAQPILTKAGVQTVIFVTEPFHAARVALVARKLGYTSSVSVTPTSPCSANYGFFSKYYLKEPFAIIWYVLKGKI